MENTVSNCEGKFLTLGKTDAWSPENEYMLNLCP